MNEVMSKAITKAQLTEELEQLRYRESLLDATEKIAHIGHCEWDYEHGCLKSCSVEYAHIFGMSINEVMQAQKDWKTWREQIHPNDQERYTDSYHSQKDTVHTTSSIEFFERMVKFGICVNSPSSYSVKTESIKTRSE